MDGSTKIIRSICSFKVVLKILNFFYKRISTFLGLFPHKEKRFVKQLNKGSNIAEFLDVILGPPLPKFSTTKEARLEMKWSQLGPASIFGYLFESHSFSMNDIMKEKATLLIV
jgi:hypothetical protein